MTELKDIIHTPDLEAVGVETDDQRKLRIARETPSRQEGKMLLSGIRADVDAIEQSLSRATKGQESIVQGGVEKLRAVAATLREIKDFLEVL